MTIASMTGFARASAEAVGRTATWEARSVNGRGLDVRLRTPPGLDRLESDDILPPALFAIAQGAGLVAKTAA